MIDVVYSHGIGGLVFVCTDVWGSVDGVIVDVCGDCGDGGAGVDGGAVPCWVDVTHFCDGG